MGLDWKPRGRDLVLGDIAWLPRITDKARADAAGTIGDYFYPCPADKGFLERHGISTEQFNQLVKDNPTDDEMAEAVSKIIAAKS
jgi:hypothetical protein